MPDRDQSALPPNAATCRDCAHVEANRVLDGGEPTWELSERGRVSRRGSFIFNGLMGSLMIELRSEGIEAGLLRADGVCWRTQRLLLERAMHALMPSVLLGVTGLDALMTAVHDAAWPMDGRTKEIAL